MQPLDIAVDGGRRVSALLEVPDNVRACLVLAHGAGAGMTHPFLADVARELAERGIATLRYQFPYMEQGSKRPDTPAVAQATVRMQVFEDADHSFHVRARSGRTDAQARAAMLDAVALWIADSQGRFGL